MQFAVTRLTHVRLSDPGSSDRDSA